MSKMTKRAARQRLRCELTAPELAKRAKELAKAVRKLRTEEEHKRMISAQLKEVIDAAEAEVKLLADTVETGQEERDVSCEIRTDYKRAVAETYRLDTGDKIASRPLSQDELQEELPATKTAGGKNGKAAPALEEQAAE